MQTIQKQDNGSNPDSLSGMNLFIVDDKPLNVSLLERMLRMEGFCNVTSTTDPRTVVATCAQHQPDLLLLDLHMPHMDGFQVMDELSQNKVMCNIPVLVLTAEQGSEARLRALKAGAKDFITKPLSRTEVITRIKNILEAQKLYIHLKTQNTNLDQLIKIRTEELHVEQQELKKLNNRLENIVQSRTKDLEIANKELEKANSAMSELVSIVSHELRTPLTSIKSFAEILRDDADHLDRKTRYKFLSIIDKESDRLSRLISDLLDLQKISSGKMVWNTGIVDLVDLCNNTVEFFTPAFSEKGLGLELSTDLAGAPVLADEDKCRQVLTNLLSNAMKFTEKGTIILKIEYAPIWAKALVVSEDENTVNALTNIFHALGGDVLHQTSHDSAIKLLERCGGNIDIMIIDIGSADSHALIGLENIRHRYPNLPLTAIYAPDHNRELGGMQAQEQKRFIQKPVDPDRDKDNIESLISDLIGIHPDTKMFAVSIIDNGMGIPQTDLKKVFMRFHQVNTSQIREQRGTGLGLTITKEIIEHYHGKIWVKSVLGKGSTFTFLLPEIRKDRSKLGEILLKRGLVTEKQLNDALRDQD